MALTAYRVLILDSPTKGVVCGGNAMVHCVYRIDAMGGVVCNSFGEEVVTPPVVPPQPETILCFKFRPGEKIYTCDLKPVVVISVRSYNGSNVYKVGMYGRVIELYEYELCSPSMVTALVHDLAEELSKRSIAKLEATPIDPPLSTGTICKKTVSPNKGEYILAIQEQAEKALAALANTPIDPDLGEGRSYLDVAVPQPKSSAIIAIAEKAQNELDKLRALREEIMA